MGVTYSYSQATTRKEGCQGDAPAMLVCHLFSAVGHHDGQHWLGGEPVVTEQPNPTVAETSFDLIGSRGSMPFWRDHVQAMKEIPRVLRPGGIASIGGGPGRLCPPEIWEPVPPGGGTGKEVGEVFHFPFPPGNLDALITRVGTAHHRVLTEGGSWLELRKLPAAFAPSRGGRE
jgi:SAM-dependent methyltransferase